METELLNKTIPTPGPQKGIPLDRMVELSKKGLSTREIAKIVGCHHSNVAERLKPVAHMIARAQDFKSTRVVQLRYLQSLALDHIDAESLQKQSALQTATTFAVLYDKERLELDKPDSINGIQLSWQDADRELPDDLAGRKQRLIGDNTKESGE